MANLDCRNYNKCTPHSWKYKIKMKFLYWKYLKKYKKQRIAKGYCDPDLWSCGDYIINLMENMIAEYEENIEAYPVTIMQEYYEQHKNEPEFQRFATADEFMAYRPSEKSDDYKWYCKIDNEMMQEWKNIVAELYFHLHWADSYNYTEVDEAETKLFSVMPHKDDLSKINDEKSDDYKKAFDELCEVNRKVREQVQFHTECAMKLFAQYRFDLWS